MSKFKKNIHADSTGLLNSSAIKILDIIIGMIPFILLILIGLIKGDITYHQKTFKTFIIFLFDILLVVTYFFYMLADNNIIEKKRKYLIYFLIYFLFIFYQYVVTFFSHELSYDTNYHMGNYTLLIIFSLFFFLYIRNLKQIEIGLLIIGVYMLAVLIWSLYDFVQADFHFTRIRPQLSFGNTDYFSGYQIGMLPLAFTSFFVWFINYLKNRKRSILIISIVSLVLAAFGIVPLLFSQTKSALFGFYIGFIVLFVTGLILLIKRLPLKKRLIIASIYISLTVILPVIILFFPPSFLKIIFRRVFEAFNFFEFFLKDRAENAWAGALGLFKNHPLFGAGLGTVYPASFKYIGKYFFLYSGSNSFKHSHCEFVEVLGESGIFGLIIFSSLVLFMLVWLFKLISNPNYTTKFRLIALGVNCGIISMLIHQIFSLSLRMSVTMTAYFFLLGISAFLISYRKKALINQNQEESNDEDNVTNKNMIISSLNKNLTFKNLLTVTIIILLLTIISLFLILKVFRSEYNMAKSKDYIDAANQAYESAMQDKNNYYKNINLFSRFISLGNNYINIAIKIRPDNPYAWTEKYYLDDYTNLNLAEDNAGKERVLNDIKIDLDKLNKLIPGYQDVWSKYADYYLKLYAFYSDTSNPEKAEDSLKKALEYIDISLSHHYLNDFSHINKLMIYMKFKNKTKFKSAMEDYVRARIYLDIAREKKIIKEKIDIQTSNISELKTLNGKYFFTIGQKDIENITEKYYNLDSTTEYESFIFSLNNDINTFFKEKYGSIYK